MSPGRTAVIVRGGWVGHDPVGTTDLFIPHLREHGFTVRVEDSSAVYADADVMAATDLVVQCATMSSIRDEEVEGLRAAVAAGTGLAGWHGGIVDAYRDSTAYLQLVGGQFAAHPRRDPGDPAGGPGDSDTAHTIDVLPEAADHPITRGLTSFPLVTEQYWVLADALCDVLATTTQAVRAGDPWDRPVVSPAIWTRQWGHGRVFVCTPGHDVAVLQDRNVRTIVERGLLWAAR